MLTPFQVNSSVPKDRFPGIRKLAEFDKLSIFSRKNINFMLNKEPENVYR